MRVDKALTIREDDQSKGRKAIKVKLEVTESADGLTKLDRRGNNLPTRLYDEEVVLVDNNTINKGRSKETKL